MLKRPFGPRIAPECTQNHERNHPRPPRPPTPSTRRNPRRAAQAPLDAPPQHAADVQGLREGTGFSSLQQHVGEPIHGTQRRRARAQSARRAGTSRRPNPRKIAPETAATQAWFEATHTDFDLYEQGCEGMVGECTGLYEQAMDPTLYIDVSKIADANRSDSAPISLNFST